MARAEEDQELLVEAVRMELTTLIPPYRLEVRVAQQFLAKRGLAKVGTRGHLTNAVCYMLWASTCTGVSGERQTCLSFTAYTLCPQSQSPCS